ncbi:MAG TPA: RpiB/LacA/LacB family sugar-phosphate isomerase, partial [Candidatus Paceibacterota bacterium]
HTQRDMAGKELDMLASSREHNNANALSLGARFLDTEAAKKAVEVWLKTGFSGEERHVRRIEKIDSLT